MPLAQTQPNAMMWAKGHSTRARSTEPHLQLNLGQNRGVHVVVDRLKCESNGLCVGYAPEVFEISDDDELVVLEESPSEGRRTAVELAVRMCPKQALSLTV